jgi:ADP-ribose pyrophosphatase YjhB (NUDIX family)
VAEHEHHEPHGYRYCPRCSHALAERLLKSGDPARLVCDGCGFIFYLDPKIAVGTIIRTADQRLVLVRRAIEPGYGKWVFPGGYVDRGEALPAAAVREAREESGLEVRLEGLVNVYSYPGRIPVVIVYAATAVAGQLRLDEESLEIAEVAPADIPWNELAFRSTHEALEDYLAGSLHPLASR